jgi:hypothetical protein
MMAVASVVQDDGSQLQLAVHMSRNNIFINLHIAVASAVQDNGSQLQLTVYMSRNKFFIYLQAIVYGGGERCPG